MAFVYLESAHLSINNYRDISLFGCHANQEAAMGSQFLNVCAAPINVFIFGLWYLCGRCYVLAKYRFDCL